MHPFSSNFSFQPLLTTTFHTFILEIVPQNPFKQTQNNIQYTNSCTIQSYSTQIFVMASTWTLSYLFIKIRFYHALLSHHDSYFYFYFWVGILSFIHSFFSIFIFKGWQILSFMSINNVSSWMEWWNNGEKFNFCNIW